MNETKKSWLAAALAVVTGAATVLAPATVNAEEKHDLGDRVSVSFDQADINYGYSTETESDRLVGRDFHVGLEATITSQLKAIARIDLARIFGLDDEDERLEAALENIYVEYTMQDGKYVRVIRAGKQDVFGALLEAAQSSNVVVKDMINYGVRTKAGVMAIAIETPPALLGHAIKASVFECGSDDLEISDCAGFTAALEGSHGPFRTNLELLASQKPYGDDWEKRAKVGVVYDNGNGHWVAYAEGMAFDDVDEAPNSNFAANLGVEIANFHGGDSVVVELGWLEKEAADIVAMYNYELTNGVILSPYVLQRFGLEGNKDDTIVGLNARLKPREMEIMN